MADDSHTNAEDLAKDKPEPVAQGGEDLQSALQASRDENASPAPLREQQIANAVSFLTNDKVVVRERMMLPAMSRPATCKCIAAHVPQHHRAEE